MGSKQQSGGGRERDIRGRQRKREYRKKGGPGGEILNTGKERGERRRSKGREVIEEGG